MMISTTGSAGGAGGVALAQQLAGQPLDAVIVLGDLLARYPSQPVVVPWSGGALLAPPALRNTVAAALGAQAGVRSRSPGVPAQLARLALPLTLSPQGPLIAAGEPAVLLSLSGERGPQPGEALPSNPADATLRLGNIGQAVVQMVDALDAGSSIAKPTAGVVLSTKVVPLWAVRLLVLALILPVLAVMVDGLARARRRGHTITRWVGWVLGGAVPFVLGLLIIKLAKLTSVIPVAPPGPVGSGQVPMQTAGLLVLIVVAIAIVAGFALLRPVCIRLSAQLSREELQGDAGAAEAAQAAGPALLLVACVVALAVWWSNPFAAALLVGALHLWIWVVDPDVRIPRPVAVLMLLVGLVPPALVIAYYVHAFGLSGSDVLWNGTLLIAGGQLSLAMALAWSVVLGCFAGVLVIAISAPGAQRADQPAVTVRGPVTYAGPGSLGGTESALRR
jgi:hypothetical protein